MNRLDALDWAILWVMDEKDPPRPEGWLIADLKKPLHDHGFKRSDDTYRNHLRKLRDAHGLVQTVRVAKEPGAPLAYSLRPTGKLKITSAKAAAL